MHNYENATREIAYSEIDLFAETNREDMDLAAMTLMQDDLKE